MSYVNRTLSPATPALRDCRFVGEPKLSDLLGDPIAGALMEADRVRRQDLCALIDSARSRFRD
jgi:hypothetical protein